MINSLKNFRVYLIGLHFKVITDCNAIRTTLSKRDLIPRIGRWRLSIQTFDFDVEYRPGHKMQHVDALSRNAIQAEHTTAQEVLSSCIVNINQDDWVLSAQLTDDRCKFLFDILREVPTDKETRKVHSEYCIENGRLYRITSDGKKWVIPRGARRQVVVHFHDGKGHMSVVKTLAAILKLYRIPGRRHYIQKYISCCMECLYNKEPGGRNVASHRKVE